MDDRTEEQIEADQAWLQRWARRVMVGLLLTVWALGAYELWWLSGWHGGR